MKKQYLHLNKIVASYRLEKEHNAKLYHQTKLLLELYRKVVWSVENCLYDLDSTATHLGSRKIQDLLNYLHLDFEGELNIEKIEDHLKNIAKSKDLVFLIDKALMKLRSYPNGGELLYNIINHKYVQNCMYTDNELMENLRLERTTYYKRKKEAINLVGTILWGYVVPSLNPPQFLLSVADETSSYNLSL